MKSGMLWRALILIGTLFCVTMLFWPLVQEMITRLMELGTDIP